MAHRHVSAPIQFTRSKSNFLSGFLLTRLALIWDRHPLPAVWSVAVSKAHLGYTLGCISNVSRAIGTSDQFSCRFPSPRPLFSGHSFCLPVCLSGCVPVCLPACLSVCVGLCLCVCVCVSVCLPACLPVCLSLCLSACVCLSLSLCLCLSVCLPVCHSLCDITVLADWA